MENRPISGCMTPSHTSFNEVGNSCEKTLLSIIEKSLLETSSDTSGITLCNLMSDKNALIRKRYQHDIEGYLHFMVSGHVTAFFTSRLEQSVEDFSKVVINSQDIKVRLKDGKEYLIDESAKLSSISSIIDETQKRLLREWRMQD